MAKAAELLNYSPWLVEVGRVEEDHLRRQRRHGAAVDQPHDDRDPRTVREEISDSLKL